MNALTTLLTTALTLTLLPAPLPAQRSDPIHDMRLRQHERRVADAERQRAQSDRRLRQLEFEQERERWRNDLRNRRWSQQDASPAPHTTPAPYLSLPPHSDPALIRQLLLADIRLAEKLFPGSTDPETPLGAKRLEIENQLPDSAPDLANTYTLTLVTSILADRELRQAAAEEAHAAALAASQSRAETLYPFLHDPASPESQRMREIEQTWIATNNPLLHSPEKPFILATLASPNSTNPQ